MLAPEMPRDSGNPYQSVTRWIFDARLQRSVGFGPVRSPLHRPDADGLAPRPVQLTSGPEFVQDHAVEPGPDPVRAPLDEPPVDRLPGLVERRRELPPRTARNGHENDRRQSLTVTGPRPAHASPS